MPRSPSVYSLPPGTAVAPNTTIQSSWANALTADIEQTFNTVQPIVYGGTGASTAGGAADAFSPAFVNVASGSTTNIGAATSPNVNITGTTTITAFDSVADGVKRFVKFAGALTLTHNATNLILPGGANITTAAGDAALFISEGSGNWRCLAYQRANGAAVAVAVGTVDVRRNRIVNHDMRVSQENGTTPGTTNGYYPVDQWAQNFVTSAGTLTVAQVASVTPAGSPNRLRATVTVADASLAAGEFWTLRQNLEGSNVADFRYGAAGAFASVLRFGFKGPAGTYGVALHNSAGNRSFVAMFTISAGQANTDIVQTIAIPGDTTGTWPIADGVIGITLDIVLAAGSTFQGSAGWQAGNILATSAISNGMGTGAAVFELFDVGLRLDPDATSVYGQYEVGEVHPVWRSERYFPAFISSGTGDTLGYGQAFAAGSAYITVPFLVETCKPPTGVAVSDAGHISLVQAASGTTAPTSASFSQASRRAARIAVAGASGLSAGNSTISFFNSASGKLLFYGCRL